MKISTIKKTNRFYSNTIMLYCLQFSNYLFNFITVPYQTRILGPGFFGKLGMATALTTYFQLLLDYGFILSATEDVASNQDDAGYLNRIFSSVTAIKFMLVFASIIILRIICFIPKFSTDWLLYFAYLLNASIYAFLPDYIYRGLERMKLITIRTVGVKFIFTILIFALLKKPSDYLIVPISLAIGNLVAVLWSWIDINKRFHIHFTKVSLCQIKATLRRSTSFFASRIVSTVYTAMNTLILGFLDPSGIVVGYYAAADKLMFTGKSALSPIADSLYPYLIKSKDFKMVKKLMLFMMPVILLFTVVMFIISPQFCSLLFGEDFYESGTILRIMLPVAVITLPSYVFGFPVLGAMGLSKYANRSIYFSTAFHILFMVFLFIAKKMNVYTVTILMVIAEFNILLYRLYIFAKNKGDFFERETAK